MKDTVEFTRISDLVLRNWPVLYFFLPYFFFFNIARAVYNSVVMVPQSLRHLLERTVVLILKYQESST